MNFQPTSQNLYKGAFAIALGIIAIPESASAVVINEPVLQNPNAPKLLISDSEQLASLSPYQEEISKSEKFAHRSPEIQSQEFDIASNRRLNQLLSANEQPELTPVFNLANAPSGNTTNPEEISKYQNKEQQNASSLNFGNHQENQIAQSSPEGISIPVYTNNQAEVNNQTNQSTSGIPIQIIPASGNQPHNNNYSQNEPVLIPTQTDFTLTNNPPTQTFEGEEQTTARNSFPQHSPEIQEDFSQTYKPEEYQENAGVPIQVQSFTANNQPTLITNQENLNFNSRSISESIATNPPSPSREVASIPIQVDFYNPTNMPPAGDIGSPELPSQLNSPDQHLPETRRPFNGYIWPARGTFTSGFGPRWGRMHRGIDIAGPVGTPIVAAADGEVISSGWNSGGFGNWVRIRHSDGSITLYAHNSRNHVRRGQQVRQGQLIADMGSTGFSTGPHLHFEIHRGGRAVDPMGHLARR
ncbi:Peptidase M23 [Cyanobacterium stanieri PCC 7202]|uniref:Peptidase M23 n=1 Tax=Cyanobacterium stanieri (strain ATCC 29140 / PCC 7202) TaxID=292563 RepID=K9YIC0_CYASC|nr:Peptidase M23 [Cyanobacterium stanieri PCC 7202]